MYAGYKGRHFGRTGEEILRFVVEKTTESSDRDPGLACRNGVILWRGLL